ncbi:putative transcription factor GRAS family [Rosa chinensis]|uniref:Putative transcription factor GRAS family n=1 Tax=Rosa chinensis TaxID=74649 RepID=A0A2P6P550_ROSCH|nr:GRAS family protein RAD1 [Rosa chinensis]PRQ17053.1 putative transcription factor GRAS family [Rosa chinensis]
MARSRSFMTEYECTNHEIRTNRMSGLELLGLNNHSSMACYSYPYMSSLEEGSANDSSLINPYSDHESRDHKKLKRTLSIADSVSSNSSINSSIISRSSSTNSLTTLPRLHFRDHIWTYTQRYLAAEAVEEAAVAMINAEENGAEQEDGTADGMRLVQLLIACAEAVACRDKSHASALLSELRANALVFGSSFQRVASCFVQGLASRLALVQPLGAVGFVPSKLNAKDYALMDKKEEALRLVYEICPHIQFGHFVANSSILEALEGESFVHVVDLGMTLGLPHGDQWQGLIQSLATRAGQPPVSRLRITGVGLCADRLLIIGEELEAYADSLGINLEFSCVESNLENLKPEDIKIFEGEVLVVNSILQLHCVVKESRGALNSVLQMIHELSPKILVLVEQDSSHNGPFFLGRFMEALHYYSAIFDSLDAMLPKYDTRRAKMEQFYFAEEIKNIISCEGPARVERHERVDQWRRRMSRAGFQGAPIKMMAQAKQWLGKNKVCEGYTVVEEKGCLVLGWKSRPIVAASCWKC